MTPSDAKVAEFAQLFDFFEKLASRRARKSTRADSSTVADDIHAAPLPQDLEPVIKRLSTIVPAVRKHDGRPTHRPRRNTMASVIDRKSSAMSLRPSDEGSDDEDEAASLAKFPLARKYPFTFKLMVHKLYGKDDWAKTVKNMLMKSKNEFRSLAEKEREELEKAAEEKDKDKEGDNEDPMGDGPVQFKVGPVHRTRRNSFASGVRQRSHSVVGVRRNSVMATSPVMMTPRSPVTPSARPTNMRALKKRCVGRRRSMSGPLNGEEDSSLSKGKLKGGTWMYNSAISYSENPASARIPNAMLFQPPPSPTEQLSRYQHMGMAQMPLSAGFNGGGMDRRRSMGGPGTFSPVLMPISSVKKANDGNLAARRRSVMLENDGMGQMEEDKRPVKRPFSG